jgi:hypothetical protein
MFRYKLRTLLILLALGPPMVAWAWVTGNAVIAARSSPKIKSNGPGLKTITTPPDAIDSSGPQLDE